MRPIRVSLRAVVFTGAVAALAFGVGSIAGASSADQNGTPVAITVHRNPDVTHRPVTWDDSKLTFLPHATTSVLLTHRSFLIVRAAESAGVDCSGDGFQFVGSTAAVALGGTDPVAVPVGGATTVLAPGTYTVGLASICQPPDDEGNPNATFQTNGTVEVDQVRVP